jgi:hypothetical protein
VIFLLMSIGIAVPLLVARIFAPDHKVIFIEWWEIALFAIFWDWRLGVSPVFGTKRWKTRP